MAGRGTAARHGHADSRSLGQEPAHEPAEAGVLRIPRLADGALGRPGGHRLHRRPLDRRHARPQRPAPGALPGHQRRPGLMASETGVLPVKPEDVKLKGRLQPGKMLLVDTVEGRIISDEEIKRSALRPQALPALAQGKPDHARPAGRAAARARRRSRRPCCCASAPSATPTKTCKMILGPMAEKGEEPIGSMGADTPLACLSDKPQPLFHYFKQLFAQVTNPPIDPIREEMVMSLTSYIGTERNILDETPQHCHTLKLPHPILTNRDLEKLRRVSQGDFLATTLPMLFPVEEGAQGPGARARPALPPRLAGHQVRLHAADPLRPRPGRGLRAHPQPAGAGRRAQPPGARRDPHAGGADHRIGRAARGDALRAADRLRRQRRQSVPGARNRADREPDAERSPRPRQLHQGHQQGPAEDLLQDGHLHAAKLPRRAGLRGHRPRTRRWSSATSPARPRASRAWAWTCSPRRPCCKHRYAFQPGHRVRDRAGRRRQLSVPRARRISPVQPADHRQAAARRAAGELPDVPGVHAT